MAQLEFFEETLRKEFLKTGVMETPLAYIARLLSTIIKKIESKGGTASLMKRPPIKLEFSNIDDDSNDNNEKLSRHYSSNNQNKPHENYTDWDFRKDVEDILKEFGFKIGLIVLNTFNNKQENLSITISDEYHSVNDIQFYSNNGKKWISFFAGYEPELEAYTEKYKEHVLGEIINALKGKSGLSEQFFECVRSTSHQRGIPEDEQVVDILNLWAAAEREFGGQGKIHISNNDKAASTQLKLSIDRPLDKKISKYSQQNNMSENAFITESLMMWSVGRYSIDDVSFKSLPRGPEVSDRAVIRRPTIVKSVIDRIAAEANSRDVRGAAFVRAVLAARIDMLEKQAEQAAHAAPQKTVY